jgi:hypothetical protein
LGALGVGTLALEACGGSPAAGPASLPSASEIERRLVELDHVLQRLDAMDSEAKSFGIRGERPEIIHGRARCLAMLTSLCCLGTYRDVPAAVWREPRVEEHLSRALPRIDATLGAARHHLATMSDEHLAAIDERLGRDPDLPMRIMERLDAYAKELGVPMDQRTYLRVSTLQLASRYRDEGTKHVTRKLTAVYGRLLDARLAELGLGDDPATEDEPTPRRGVSAGQTSRAASFLGWPDAQDPRGVGEACRTDFQCAEELACDSGQCVPAKRSRQLLRTTKKTAVYGAIFLIPPLCGIGVLILLQCLFMVIVAGIMSAGGD